MAHGLAGLPALPASLISFIEGVELPSAQRILGKALHDFVECFSVRAFESLRERDSRTLLRWRSCLPAKLFREKRPLHSWGYSAGSDSVIHYITREWAPLREPFSWDELLPNVERTLTRLAIPTDWLRESPKLEHLVLDGTDYDEFRWCADKRELLVLAIDGISDDLGGGEVRIPMVFSQLILELVSNGERQIAELCLVGINGVFQAASVEGPASKRVARAWGGMGEGA